MLRVMRGASQSLTSNIAACADSIVRRMLPRLGRQRGGDGGTEMPKGAALASRALFKGIATAIGTAIGSAAVGWWFGWWPTIWELIRTSTVALWGFVALPVTLPLGIVAIISLPLVGLLVVLVAAMIRRNDAVAPAAPQQLDELELHVLRVLARADGVSVSFDELVERLSTPRLVLERACDSLRGRGFIESHTDYMRGALIDLTRPGRDFVLGANFPLG